MVRQAVRGEVPAVASSQIRALDTGVGTWAPGIDAIWTGADDVYEGMSSLERACMRTVESAAPSVNLALDPDIYVLHRRSAARGVRSRGVREVIAPAALCDSRTCGCKGQFYYGDLPGLPLKVHVVDQSIAVIALPPSGSVESKAVVTGDPTVVADALRYIDGAQQMSMPVLPKDRRAPLRPTLRQLRILHLMAYGLTDEKVASELRVTSRTVRNDVGALYVMFDVHSRFELGIAYRDWIAGR